VSVTVEIELNGVTVPITLSEDAVAAIADAVTKKNEPEPENSPYMTIIEAADYLRASRQRVDDLLSQRRLTRYKDGTRTLVSRDEITRYLSQRR
jgi:excisionase family DNA binding protein